MTFKTIFRGAMAFVSAVAAQYFVFWMGGALTLWLGPPPWVLAAASTGAAIAAGVYVWRRTASSQPGLFSSIGFGAVVVGAIGFCAGFFGPLIFAPDANQGPLLGIFITGPLGFLLGGIGGAVRWFTRGRRSAKSSGTV